jgi:hypothetical protein
VPRHFSFSLQILGILVMVIAGVRLAHASSAGCSLNVLMDLNTGMQYEVNNGVCPSVTCDTGSTCTTSDYIQGGTGFTYKVCTCPGESTAPCLEGFRITGSHASGVGQCLQAGCVNPCHEEWVSTPDPEVDALTCPCN